MVVVEAEVGGKKVSIETGRMARQADGSTLIKVGDTVVLSTAVADKKVKEAGDFFPLTIDYQEKTYSAGKIPGGFFKREGRSSEKEVLTSRLIDRPIRPLFPKGFYSDTQGIASVLSFGTENVSDVMSVTGMSASLMISDIPFNGPISAVRIGRLDGEFVINPDLTMLDRLTMDLVVAGTDDAVAMVEGSAQQASEADFLEAIDVAHAAIKVLNALQRELQAKAGKEKRPIAVKEINEELKKQVEDFSVAKIKEAVAIPDKLRRQEAVSAILKDAQTTIGGDDEAVCKEIAGYFYGFERSLVRGAIVETGIRADGRKSDEIRQITSEVSVLPRTHGSALFVRGETQALVIVTLGTTDDEQRIDALEGEYYKNFMLHYNFPPFSVGEVKFLRGPSRRDIGHGNLAERSFRSLMPAKEEFPYTIRIVSDILESNGSSSMATVCGATLALLDAGVPLKAPVAGIAMGLIKEGEKTIILTDILGLEDHLGDMDFKVTGTENGITAFQMDSKLGGINRELMQEALDQARRGRLFILDKMQTTISAPRQTLSAFAPRIVTIQVKQDRIKDVIGSGGKVIKGIIAETGVKMDVADNGLVSIASADAASLQRAIDIIKGILEEPEVGKIYTGKVVRITDFGAFVEILPNTDGLLHISQIDEKRIEKVTDVLKEGDEVTVKVIEIDKLGRVRLSRKEVLMEQRAGK